MMKDIKSKKSWTGSFEKVKEAFDDLETLYEFYQAGDVEDDEINNNFKKTETLLEDLEFKKMHSNEEDQLSAMMEINPGAGGTESNDWAEMLMRMYIMWGESHGFKVKEVYHQPGETAGLT